MIDLDRIGRGLDQGEFFLEFMPTIRLQDDRCVGGEALIRWHKDNEIIQPLDFIPLVENTPLSESLTCWIVEEIGRDLGTWLHEHNGIHLGINIPPEIIGRGGIVRAAEKAGLLDVSEKFIFEITERGKPDQIAIDALNSVKGLHIAVDDFGTGDFNLLDLSKLEISVIKIDKAFVHGLGTRAGIKMIKGLMALAREFGARVIAEGVETWDQVSAIKTLGVDMAQGWFYSKPLSTAAFLAYFKKNK